MSQRLAETAGSTYSWTTKESAESRVQCIHCLQEIEYFGRDVTAQRIGMMLQLLNEDIFSFLFTSPEQFSAVWRNGCPRLV